MPWLVGTALIHSLAVTEKRGSFKNWTVLLAILAFSLSLLGTFLVRSGVLSSVHAFATDPRRGLFILAFLVVVIGASLALYAWRAPTVGLGARFALLSRETLLLGNNVLLLVACGAVLLGTLYPLALDALGMGKISVGPPYFDTVFVPLMTPLVFLMGIGPLARWKETELPDLASRLQVGGGCGGRRHARSRCGCAAAIGIVGTVGLLMAFWIIGSIATDLVERLRPVGGVRTGLLHRARLIPRSIAGMQLAHLGVAVFILGVTLVKTDEVERDVRMQVGDTHRRSATWRSPSAACARSHGPNYRAAQGTIEVTDKGRPVVTLHPEKRIYPATQSTMTEADIDAGLTRDLYVSLGEPVDGGAWIVRVYVKPFVDWIWGGCLVMALGGLLAASDRRYRAKVRRTAEASTQRGERSMKRFWFLIPLAAFLALAVLLARRPEARSARGAVAADRQAGAEVRAAAARRRRQDDPPRRHARQGLGAQRLGLVVRRLPRGASAAGRVRAEARSCRSTASTTRTSARTPRAGSPASATPTTPRSSTTTAASASTSASTACPRPSSSTRTASSASSTSAR